MIWYQRRDKSFTKLDGCIEFYWEEGNADENKFIVWALRDDRTVSPVEEFESEEEMKDFIDWLFGYVSCDNGFGTTYIRHEHFEHIYAKMCLKEHK
ncbi:MAG: hypothetical protein WC248_05125 [Candidatus Methanomethylophilaceae archaeon]